MFSLNRRIIPNSHRNSLALILIRTKPFPVNYLLSHFLLILIAHDSILSWESVALETGTRITHKSLHQRYCSRARYPARSEVLVHQVRVPKIKSIPIWGPPYVTRSRQVCAGDNDFNVS